MFQARTDLALESKEKILKENGELRGLEFAEEELTESRIHITRAKILTKNAARAMGKPVGNYITVEALNLPEQDYGSHREIAECLARELVSLLSPVGAHDKREYQKDDKYDKSEENEKGHERNILVIGLGNRDVTADSLGPLTTDHLNITRHIVKEFGTAAYDCREMYSLSALEPGVMARTGMETVEIIKGVVSQTKPIALVVVDALAARSIKRLHKTIQITDSGIQPGSGVGNHRSEITQGSVGVPVIAIGVPMVVDAATIVTDTLEKCISDSEMALKDYLGVEQKDFCELSNMYMTGKDIDEVVRRVSYVIAEGINIAMTACMK